MGGWKFRNGLRKNAARADNLQKNRTFEEKAALCRLMGNGCVGSWLVCDHAPEDADISVRYSARGNWWRYSVVKNSLRTKKRACKRVADPVKQP